MIKRYKNNPIITPDMITPSIPEFKIVSVINAAATTFNNKILLLLRIAEQPDVKDNKNSFKSSTYKSEIKKSNILNDNYIKTAIYDLKEDKFKVLSFSKNDPEVTLLDTRGVRYKNQVYLSSISHLRIAESLNGMDFNISSIPTITPTNIYEEYGIEDPRITKFEENSKIFYIISYTSVSRYGIAVSLIKTFDFKKFERLGVVLPPDNKDVVLFPQKIDGYYYMLHRPMKSAFNPPSMWLSTSKDFIHWGNHKFLMGPRKGYFDSERIGAGDTPVLIDEGWLEIYHGVDKNSRYHLGAILMDKNNPEIIIKRSKFPILSPETEYEKHGFYGNVVFTCGSIKKEDKLMIYYGAADESLGYVEMEIDDIFSSF